MKRNESSKGVTAEERTRLAEDVDAYISRTYENVRYSLSGDYFDTATFEERLRRYRRFFFCGDGRCAASLLSGFERAYHRTFPAAKAVRISGKAFAAELLGALRTSAEGHAASDILIAMSRCDLFILEGVEDLAGMQMLMEWLYVLIDKLYERGSTVLFFSPHPPEALRALGMAERNVVQLEGCVMLRIK